MAAPPSSARAAAALSRCSQTDEQPGVVTLPPLLRTKSLAAMAAATALLALQPALAQVSTAQVRALNLARNWAIDNNGGLAVYVPAACMFNTGDGGGACLVSHDGQGYRYSFLGGAPGWQQNNQSPSQETELLISGDGRRVLSVLYNGRPR
jgi:hypothetical protein